MDDRLRAILAELRRQFAALYGDRLVKMILYGSQARGDAEPDSDIDVLVVLKGPLDWYGEIRRTSEIVSDLSLCHNVLISRMFYDAHEFDAQDGAFLENVRREGIPIE